MQSALSSVFTDLASSVSAIANLLTQLPPENYRNLRYLLGFLYGVSLHAEKNHMTPSNLAICMGPNLLWPDPSVPVPSLANSNSNSNSIKLLNSTNPITPNAPNISNPNVSTNSNERKSKRSFSGQDLLDLDTPTTATAAMSAQTALQMEMSHANNATAIANSITETLIAHFPSLFPDGILLSSSFSLLHF